MFGSPPRVVTSSPPYRTPLQEVTTDKLFTLIAALRPTIIKIDREIVHGCAANDAKKALVEAFVSFSRRINARLIAEGIETHRELDTLRGLGVELGQGYLLGRPAIDPGRPRSLVARPAARSRRQAVSRPG